jgi:hypothetical protein
MKLKFKKAKKGWWIIGLRRGKGGISSLVAERQGPLLFAVRVLTPRNIWRALAW